MWTRRDDVMFVADLKIENDGCSRLGSLNPNGRGP